MSKRSFLIFAVLSIVVIVIVKSGNYFEGIDEAVNPPQVQTEATIQQPDNLEHKSDTKRKQPKGTIDVHDIVGKNLYFVEKLLGKCEESEEGNWKDVFGDGSEYKTVTCYFQNEKHSVMFHDGKAVRVRIGVPSDTFQFPDDAKEAMEYVGLTGIGKLEEVPTGVHTNKVDDFSIAEAGKWADYKGPYIQFVKVVFDERFR
ncbi:hypothetical protein P4S95_08315 [Aneurinibacillus aneurinilyticus]|uniref:hypothetical protein n=1 Tax=Aneurinibacillus aneurinilyticus TaxID=1391 RepID=UPI002E22BE68|nr:hypothetical protein [Aneurinibacillus aneurinilyticus]